MTHHQLGFKTAYGIQSNTDDDQQGCSAESDINADEVRGDDRENCQHAEEDSTDQDDTVDDLTQIICSRLTGQNSHLP